MINKTFKELLIELIGVNTMEVKKQTFSFMLLLLIQQLQHLIWTNSTGPLIVFSSTFKAKFKREGKDK